MLYNSKSQTKAITHQKLHNLSNGPWPMEKRVSATVITRPLLNYLLLLWASQLGKRTRFLGCWTRCFLVKCKLEGDGKQSNVYFDHHQQMMAQYALNILHVPAI